MPEQKQNLQQAAREILGVQDPAEKTEGIADQEDSKKSKIPVLHTLKGDISEYMKSRDLSLTEIAAQTSKQKTRSFDEESTQGKKFLLLIVGIILLVGGLTIGGWFIFFREKPIPFITSGPQLPKSLIFSDKQEILTLKSADQPELANLIQQSFKSSIGPDTILDIPILLEIPEKKEFLEARDFFKILGINLPANLAESLEGPFTLGIFNYGKNLPFLILKINSFDFAFRGALDWEKNMTKDLSKIMPVLESTSTEQKFQDKTLENHDMRALYDTSSNPIIIYAFLGQKYLVITTDLNTLKEIFRRFSISPTN